jgi:hypothetical protein
VTALEAIAPGGWAPYLDPGERLLWEGRPATGLRWSRQDLFLLPFGLVFAGFAIFWEVSVIAAGAPLFMVLFGVPFVLVGLFLAVGRVFWDSYARRHTAYALTDRRAIVATSALGRALRSWPITPGMETEFRPGPESTLVFASEWRPGRRTRRGHSAGRRIEHAFRHIPDGDRVHALFRAIQRARTPQTEAT